MSEEISKYELFNKYEEAKKLLLIDYDINKDKRYLVAISALEKQLNGGWVPVSERLPEEYGCYLVAWRPTDLTAEDIIKNTGTVPHYYEILAFNNAFVDGWDDIEQCDEYEILAWQPLPEPYKEVENEN